MTRPAEAWGWVRTQNAQALLGNLIQHPASTLNALPKTFTPDVMPPNERRVWVEARAIAEGNGRARDSCIEAGEVAHGVDGYSFVGFILLQMDITLLGDRIDLIQEGGDLLCLQVGLEIFRQHF